jgi:hypothetical protein
MDSRLVLSSSKRWSTAALTAAKEALSKVLGTLGQLGNVCVGVLLLCAQIGKRGSELFVRTLWCAGSVCVGGDSSRESVSLAQLFVGLLLLVSHGILTALLAVSVSLPVLLTIVIVFGVLEQGERVLVWR